MKDVIDAEFEVVSEGRRPPQVQRRERFIDWRNALWIIGMSVVPILWALFGQAPPPA